MLTLLVPLVGPLQTQRPAKVLELLEALTPLRRLDQYFMQYRSRELVGVERAFDPAGFHGLVAEPKAFEGRHGAVGRRPENDPRERKSVCGSRYWGAWAFREGRPSGIWPPAPGSTAFSSLT